jgi:hypothetical protein
MEGVQLDLYFGSHLIGTVSDTYYSDFNWYGTFRPADVMPSRIQAFIAFCRDWHARLDAAQSPDAGEFDPWRDIHDSSDWQSVGSGAIVKRIRAPVFWPNTEEICWREARGV